MNKNKILLESEVERLRFAQLLTLVVEENINSDNKEPALKYTEKIRTILEKITGYRDY